MKDCVFVQNGIPQWKGNLHMHSTRSDGLCAPGDAVAFYRDAGYNFCMLSDHDVYWDNAQLITEKFITLAGTESSVADNPNGKWTLARKNNRWMHMCAIKDPSAPAAPELYDGAVVPREKDTGLDSWNRQIEYLRDTGHIVVLNHPRWSRLPLDTMLGIQGCFAVEVWNTLSEYDESVGESEFEWDYCLRNGKKLYGVAADDSHRIGDGEPEVCGGFVMVSAAALSGQAIVDALREGHFYASQAPFIYSMRVEDGVFKLDCSPASLIRLVAYEGYAPTTPARPEPITHFEWKIKETLKYFRAEVVDAQGHKAWSQPVMLDELE